MFNREELKTEIAESLKAYVEENIKTKTQAEYVRTQWPSDWAESDTQRMLEVAEARAMKYFQEQVSEFIADAKCSIDDDLNAAYFIKYFD